jgi:hypothetical protein
MFVLNDLAHVLQPHLASIHRVNLTVAVLRMPAGDGPGGISGARLSRR